LTNAFLYVLSAAALIPAFLIAIPVHEMGHALVAYLLGDRSVRYFGYFTWNPRRFLDLFGVIAVFIALVGWGRPVPIQSNKIDTTGKKVLVKLGGPGANLAAAVVLGLLIRALPVSAFLSGALSIPLVLGVILHAIVFLNLSLFAFQLLPFPGLDGWEIVETVFRSYNARFFFNVATRRREIWIGAVIIIFVGSIFGVRVLDTVMTPFYEPASLIAQGGCAGYITGYHAALWPCLP
jgi:Zn-dependent protease